MPSWNGYQLSFVGRLSFTLIWNNIRRARSPTANGVARTSALLLLLACAHFAARVLMSGRLDFR